MQKSLFLIGTFIVLSLPTILFAGSGDTVATSRPEIHVNITKQVVSTNEPFGLTIETIVSSGSMNTLSAPDIHVSGIESLNVRGTADSMKVEMINGSTSFAYERQYSLLGQRPGVYRLTPAITMDGRTWTGTTMAVEIQATSATTIPSSPSVLPSSPWSTTDTPVSILSTLLSTGHIIQLPTLLILMGIVLVALIALATIFIGRYDKPASFRPASTPHPTGTWPLPEPSLRSVRLELRARYGPIIDSCTPSELVHIEDNPAKHAILIELVPLLIDYEYGHSDLDPRVYDLFEKFIHV